MAEHLRRRLRPLGRPGENRRGIKVTRRVLVRGAVASAGLAALPLPQVRRAAATLAGDFGARGDGKADDSQALTHALNSGSILDGENRVFAVTNAVKCGERFKGLVNARLTQINPGGDERRRTLLIQKAAGFVLENVDVDRGGNGSEIADRAMIGHAGGIFIVDGSRFQLRGVSVRGGGIGSGLAIINCVDFTGDDLMAHDIWYRLPEHPGDDAIHGMYLLRSRNFTLTRGQAHNLGGSDGATDSYRVTRGFGIAGCSAFRLIDPEVKRIGQGIDISGSDGNHDFSITGGLAEDCESWGFKFANSAHHGTIEGATARRVGLGGFVVSGETERGNPHQSYSITMRRCVVQEVLGSHRGASFGFGVMAVRRIDPSYPRDILFRDCAARTVLPTSRMEFGFRNDVPAPLTKGKPNQAIDCHAEGWRQQEFHGFG